MDALQFDHLTRRFVLGGLPAALGLGRVLYPDIASAKKHKKKKKVKLNAFGCVNVGNFCQNSGQCCSGICQGKKGKSKCQAHDAGVGCEAGVPEEGCGGRDISCTTATGIAGICELTTGNAGYCCFGFTCFACSKDADCQAQCGPAAVCVRCAEFCPDTGGTACVNPTETSCP
jgi:hypothetical protein